MVGMQEWSATFLVRKFGVDFESRSNRMCISRRFGKADAKGGRKLLSFYASDVDIAVQAGARLVISLNY
jgi:hypothetical protein